MTVIDARGHRCPVPSLKLRKAMAAAQPGAELVLLATDPMARIDVPFLLQETGGRLLSVSEEDGVVSFRVVTRGAPTD